MPAIEGGRWDGRLRRLLGISDYGPAPGISTELVGTVETQPFDPELRAIGDERLAIHGRRVVAGGAATNVQCQLFNPVGSRFVGVVEEVWVSIEAAGGITLSAQATVIANNTKAVSQFRDRRFGALSAVQPVLEYQFANANGGVPGFQMASIRALANAFVRMPLPWVIVPGDSLIVTNDIVNSPMSCTFAWRERFANPAELALV